MLLVARTAMVDTTGQAIITVAGEVEVEWHEKVEFEWEAPGSCLIRKLCPLSPLHPASSTNLDRSWTITKVASSLVPLSMNSELRSWHIKALQVMSLPESNDYQMCSVDLLIALCNFLAGRRPCLQPMTLRKQAAHMLCSGQDCPFQIAWLDLVQEVGRYPVPCEHSEPQQNRAVYLPISSGFNVGPCPNHITSGV